MTTATAPATDAKNRKLRNRLIGMVTSDKVNKTRKVVFEYLARHAKYNKYVKRQTVLHVHDEKNESRVGDQVEVMVRGFAEDTMEEPAFYETGWFATVLRYGVTLIGLVLVLLLGVRPILAALKSRKPAGGGAARPSNGGANAPMPEQAHDAIDRSLLNRQVGAAQKFAEDRPDRAVLAIRQMLNQGKA